MILVKLIDRGILPLPEVPVVFCALPFPRSCINLEKAFWAVERSPDWRALPTAARSVLKLVLPACELVPAFCEFVLPACKLVPEACELVFEVCELASAGCELPW